ncbi:MAG: branched-chain amino acid ABC transporter substrate-binding protein, partial [Pseudomonadota bacterium]
DVISGQAIAEVGARDFLNLCAQRLELVNGGFDGLGNGKTLYRAEDHQCFKDVLVVKGKEKPTSDFDLLEIVEVTPVDKVTYAPDHPQMRDAQGNPVPIGKCNAGA